MTVPKDDAFPIGQDCLECCYEEVETYRDSLYQILKWAHKNSSNQSSPAGDFDPFVQGDANELFEALSNAGFEVEYDGKLLDGLFCFAARLCRKLPPEQKRWLLIHLLKEDNILHDLLTHQDSWRKLIVQSSERFTPDLPAEPDAFPSYQKHELAAFDRVFGLLSEEAE